MEPVDTSDRAILQVAIQELVAAQDKVWGSLKEAVHNREGNQSHASLECLLTLQTAADAVRIAGGIDETPYKPIYLINSWFLHDCRRHLTQTEDEAMLFVTGPEAGKLRVLSRTMELQYAEQSRVFVRADDLSTREVLNQLDGSGHRMLAWFHRHPGDGAGMTTPSCIDLDHQGDLEKGGYPAVGAIFTVDGWVRFFSVDTEFEVMVFGSKIVQIDQRLFRLSEPEEE